MMKLKLSSIKGDLPGHVKVKKAAAISIAFNALILIFILRHHIPRKVYRLAVSVFNVFCR